MNRSEIIDALRPYFKVSELVCPHCFKKWGERSWQFLDTDALLGLLIIRRDIIQKPMVINNGKAYTQRGLRCNLCSTVKGHATIYQSQHIFGKAWDFTVIGMTSEEARELIKANAELFPFNFRLEKYTSWVHWDCMPQYGVTDKVYEFKG